MAALLRSFYPCTRCIPFYIFGSWVPYHTSKSWSLYCLTSSICMLSSLSSMATTGLTSILLCIHIFALLYITSLPKFWNLTARCCCEHCLLRPDVCLRSMTPQVNEVNFMVRAFIDAWYLSLWHILSFWIMPLLCTLSSSAWLMRFLLFWCSLWWVSKNQFMKNYDVYVPPWWGIYDILSWSWRH